MHRQIIYPGQIPLETDLLYTNKNAMIGLAKLAATMFGSTTFVNGLATTQSAVPALTVLVAPGEIYALKNVDDTAYSSVAADTTHQIVKQGLLLDSVTLSTPAPGTVGQSINYLVQAAYADSDTDAVVLPYYNASNPAVAYSGPANAGTTNTTVRKGLCNVTVKVGTAAATGTQVTPAPDAGNVGLFVVAVANGQTTVLNANISQYAAAPILPSTGIIAGGFQGNGFNVAAAAGTVDAITANFTPNISALSNGMLLYVRSTGANTITTPSFTPNSGVIAAKTIVKGAGSALAVADISGWMLLQYDLSLDKWILQNPATGVSITNNFTRNYLSGLTLSTAGSSTTMSIAAGQAADSTNTVLINLAASISKTTGAWAVGTGNGGKLSAAAIAANTWYYFYEIRRPDTGVVDIGFDVSSSAPTLPANYTQYRYLGGWPTDGSSNWTAITQTGRDFVYSTPVLDFSGAGSATAALLTCSLPRGRKMKGLFSLYHGGTSGFSGIYLSDPANADLAPSGTVAPLASFATNTDTGNTNGGAQATCWTNTSGQIRHREANTRNTYIATLGWTDLADTQ